MNSILMKKTLSITVVILFTSSLVCFSQWNPELKSNLEDVVQIESSFYDHNGKIKDESSLSHYKDGKRIRYQYFKENELVRDDNYVYEYDKNRETVTHTNPIPEWHFKTVNTYDKKGRLKKSIRYDLNHSVSEYFQSKFKYNKADQLVAYRITNVQGPWKMKTDLKLVYPNDSTIKRITMSHHFDGVGYEMQYEYDSVDEVALGTQTSYEYIYLNPKSIHKNRKISSSFDTNPNTLIESDTIKIKGEILEVKKKILKTKYIYDQRGNWVEAYQLNPNGDQTLAIGRKISYISFP